MIRDYSCPAGGVCAGMGAVPMRGKVGLLSFWQESLQLYDETLVSAFAYLLLLVVRFDFEDEPPAVDLDEFGMGAHALSERRGGQVLDVDESANGDMTLLQVVGDGPPGGVFHERDHHGRAEDFDSPRSDCGSGVFVDDNGAGFTGDTYL